MKKITLFFCDVYGTFISSEISKVNTNLINKFVSNLDSIRICNGSDEVFFSFITLDNPEIVLSIEHQLNDAIVTKNINIGSHFCGDINKPLEIINYINYLKEHYIINQIYYADDCEFYHSVLKELFIYFNSNDCINSIVPTVGGLSEINSILEGILKSDIDEKKGRINA